MQYTVPQFIDREDKILGPITVRQFLLLIVGAIFVAVAYAALPGTYFIVSAIVIMLITVIVAFVKINGRPFHFFLLNLVERIKRPNARVWNKELTNSELKHYLKVKKEEQEEQILERPRLTTSRLSQLALVVDTGGGYRGEDVFDALKPVAASKPEKEDKES